jgi:TonB family protein
MRNPSIYGSVIALSGVALLATACASLTAQRATETALRGVCGTATTPADSSCIVRSTTRVSGGYLVTIDRRPPAGQDRVQVRVTRGGSIEVTPATLTPGVRFPQPESFVVIAEDSAGWPRPAGTHAPLYPKGARLRHEDARVIVAAIIDSTGVPEQPSVTLLSPPNPDFDRAVCAYFADVHFNWPPGRGQRALVIIPFDFTVGADEPPPALNYRELAASFNAIPRQELVTRLEAERHCT